MTQILTKVTAVGTSDTDCYVVPKNFKAHIKHLLLTNSNASSRTFTIKIYNKLDNATTTIMTSHSLTTITALSVFTLDKPLFLQSEDKIFIAASDASSIVSVIAVEEFFNLTA